MGICRASRYEHKSTVSIAKQCDMRIPAVIAGARSAEQSAFIHGGTGEAGMEVTMKAPASDHTDGRACTEQSAFIHGGAGEAGMEVRNKEVGQEDFTYSFQPLDTWK